MAENLPGRMCKVTVTTTWTDGTEETGTFYLDKHSSGRHEIMPRIDDRVDYKLVLSMVTATRLD